MANPLLALPFEPRIEQFGLDDWLDDWDVVKAAPFLPAQLPSRSDALLQPSARTRGLDTVTDLEQAYGRFAACTQPLAARIAIAGLPSAGHPRPRGRPDR